MSKKGVHHDSDRGSNRVKNSQPLRPWLAGLLPHTTHEVWHEAALAEKAHPSGYATCPDCGVVRRPGVSRASADAEGRCLARKACELRQKDRDGS